MWVFLSSRIRTWIVLAVAVPILRRIVQRILAARAARHPDAKTTSALRRTDGALATLQRTKRGGRKSG